MRTRRRRLLPGGDQLDKRCLLSGFSPAQLTHAYGLDAITFTSPSGSTVKGDGSGQTIALVEAYHDPALVGDLHAFDRAFNLPDPALTTLNLGGTLSNAGWALEESLDVEWAHAIAPRANLVVVEARSQSRSDLLAAVNAARNLPSVGVISMSWGFGEAPYQSSSHYATPPGHMGITMVAASGDDGLAGGAEWPATSRNVLAVGGTSLTLDNFGNYRSEAAWSGSGGGYSRFEVEPAYQRTVQATGKRSTPDVAFDADPGTGVAVYATSLSTGQGSWQTVGGTSLGTPAWAAIIAIANQGRALAGRGTLDGPTQTLPTLYALPPTDFHTMAGSSHFAREKSAAGANLATGLGSPNAPALVADLVATNMSVRLRTSAANSRRAGHPTVIRHHITRHIETSPGAQTSAGCLNPLPESRSGINQPLGSGASRPHSSPVDDAGHDAARLARLASRRRGGHRARPFLMLQLIP
jgi:hypothetical protein